MPATAAYRVAGMTCEHCVNAVRSELLALDGVTDVEIQLDPDAPSTVTVTSTTPLRPAQVDEALDEAGDYRLQP